MKKFIFALIIAFLAVGASAATYIVDDDGPADFNTIQAAIDFADDNDIIIVYEGSYREQLNLLGKAITVQSSDPNIKPYIRYGGGCIKFYSGEDANTVINGFYLEGGSTYGGGIDCNNSSPTIINCLFRECSADYGDSIACRNYSSPKIINCIFNEECFVPMLCCGVLFCENHSNPTIIDCTFKKNCCGGIFCRSHSNPTIINCTFEENYLGAIGCSDNSNPTISDCTFIYNVANNGAGVYCNNSSPVITDCSFTGNDASWGGAIFCKNNSDPIVNNCTFTQNTATGLGGAMYCGDNSSPTINNCTFTLNHAGIGGGMCNDYSSPMVINCIFVANSAYKGGGISDGVSNSTLINCVLSGNSASIFGGGIAAIWTQIKMANCTFSGNLAPEGNALAFDSYNFNWPSNFEMTNCILSDGGQEIWNNNISTIIISYTDLQGDQAACYDPCNAIVWSLGNIDVDPCFVEPGYWNPNGTPTDANDDFWVDGDYHLKSAGWRWDSTRSRWDWDDVTSRCIDAGNPGCGLADEPLTIPDDPNNIWGQNLRINMGAYGGTAEASMPPYDWALLCDIDNSGIVNLKDFAWLSMLWLNQDEELFSDFNRDLNIDSNDLDLFTEDWLSATTWH